MGVGKRSSKRELICFKDNKVQCFNDDKVRSLRGALASGDGREQLSRRFKALSHPARLAILELLAHEECCVCDLANVLESPVSTLSQHLKTLKLAGLVRSRQSGKFVLYSLENAGLAEAEAFFELSATVRGLA